MRVDGKAYKQIAEHFGIAVTTAHAWCDDPDGSKKRDRIESYRAPCTYCGTPTNGSNGRRGEDEDAVCVDCAPDHYATWTREATISVIQEWAAEHGGVPPTSMDFTRAKVGGAHVPAVNSVIKRFGTWNKAIIAAGFEPHRTGPVGGYTPLTPMQRRQAARRYRAGESSVQIAADFGCAPQTVINWARRFSVPIRPGMLGHSEQRDAA